MEIRANDLGIKDKKKMVELGFEELIGFIPYAGIGYKTSTP
jgi:hypothetical protein